MRRRVLHQTTYSCVQPVSVGHNEARLTPRKTANQTVLSHRLDVDPPPSTRSTLIDYFGNTVTQFLFNQGYSSLAILSQSEVELVEPPGADAPGPDWESVLAEVRGHPTLNALRALEFTFASPRCRVCEEFADYGRASCRPGLPIRAVLDDLLDRFRSDFRYDPTATSVSTPVEHVFRQRVGVCQDFAHLFISILRSLGFAARYVSGYLRTVPPPGQPRLIGADASHAWLSVYAGAMGWIDVDPTNRQFVSTDHVTVAWGRDYGDVAPVKGVYVGGTGPLLHVSVDVEPCEPAGTPQPTCP